LRKKEKKTTNNKFTSLLLKLKFSLIRLIKVGEICLS